MPNDYQPETLEASVQKTWEKAALFHAALSSSKPRFYCLSMMPYPSGELHMGHVRNYVIGDVIARYERMRGKNVMQPMAWDAFGLPAENAAIARKLAPNQWTRNNIDAMRSQLKTLGLSYDWSREITTCDPSYYRWEQWLFVQLIKKGLAYKKKSWVNWDPVDQTVLANEQVVDGKGWRSGAPIERREIAQWFLKITDYADALLNDLETLDWPPSVIQMQRNWIGKSTGVEITFAVEDEKVSIFTTRPDTLMGVTYLGLATEHPLVKKAALKNPALKKFLDTCKQMKVAEADVETQEKCGINTGLFATHPITQEKLPVWATNFVLMDYGSGAVMAVPAHDARDHAFAIKYALPIKPVIEPLTGDWDFQKAAMTDDGKLIHSGQFDGLIGENAVKVIQDFLVKEKMGKMCVHFRLRDWGIWGTPIPVVHCDKCGDVPVDESDLPVLLPTHLIPDGKGSPLANDKDFYETTCPTCHGAAKRETDTMDTFMESSWYYARIASYDCDTAILDARANDWAPVDQYVGGIEHAVLHLLYARFMHKVLRDLGFLKSNEPFKRLLTQGMVIKDGTKMSKSKGNVVAPAPFIQKYGADTVRLFMMFASPPEQNLEWSDAGVEGAYRFLKKLWRFADSNSAILSDKNSVKVSNDKNYGEIQKILQQANQDMERQQFNTVVSACMKLFNVLQTLPNDSALLPTGFKILLQLLAPIAPHMADYWWGKINQGASIVTTHWPAVDAAALDIDQYELIIQINGKLRGKISVSSDENEAAIKEKVLLLAEIQKHIQGKKVQRIIVVPKRLINIVVS